MSFIQDNEDLIRLSVFFGTFVAMALWEVLSPRTKRVLPRMRRWCVNWALVIIDSLTLRLLVPVLAVGVAGCVADAGWGILNWVVLPTSLKVILAVVVLDMLIYWQHVASHRFAVLWRFHRVHHADRDIDVTTGARFHPVEILLSMVYKFACIALLGAPAMAVFLFEVLLNASAMFNHSNVTIERKTDQMIRKLIVTPDMHRVHHSIEEKETNSNYGFFLSVWDRLFRTYIDQPKGGHEGMTIGLREFQSDEPSSLRWSLLSPFMKSR